MRGEWLQNPTSNTAVVFVHGILSSGESGWRNANGAYWPTLLQSEKDLHGLGLYVYSYQTDIFSGNYQLGDVVDDLKERMKLDGVLKNRRILFVCHSMGGIVVRQYLVTRALDLIEAEAHVGLFLVASPSLGSEYANWLEAFANIFGQSQAQALRFAQNNAWLNDLDKNFKNLQAAGKLQLTGKELLEDKFIALRKFIFKQVVEPFSGARYFGEPYKVPHSDHFSIAKPESANAIQHRLLVQFIKDMQQAPLQYASPAAPANVALNAQRDISARDVIGRDQHVDQSITVGNLTNTSGVAIGPNASVTIIQQPPPAFNPLHQLPSPPRDFTGREEELRELLVGLENGGAMISGLHGMGGIGKTALALVLAEKLKPRFPDAQFFLDLRGASHAPLSAGQAMAHVIRAYLPEARLPETEAELAPLYHSVLHEKRALLLFDNARDAEQVQSLLPPAPCALLVTSRQHFTLPGLYAKDLSQLSSIEAEALLLKICSRIAALAPELAALCGYLPLALRLAASALAERRDLSPSDYARRLQNAQQRVALIEASLRLSYDLLASELQAQWRALAVFPESFDRSAAAAVWQMEADPAHDILSTLHNYSLLDWREHTQRYRLHDLARLFAEQRLAEEEKFAAQQRHAEHYKDVLHGATKFYLKGNESLLQSLRLFDIEWPNIAAGQAWAAAHMRDNEVAADLCNNYPNDGEYFLNMRLPPYEKIVWSKKALEAAELLSNRWMIAQHLGRLGAAYGRLGQHNLAIEYFEKRLVFAQEFNHHRGIANAFSGLGESYFSLGEYQRAIDYHEKALVLYQKIPYPRGVAAEFFNLGHAFASWGEARRAIGYFEQALVIDRENGDLRGKGTDLWNLSLAFDQLNERERAVPLAEAALQIYEQIEDPNAEQVRRTLAQWRGRED